MVGQLLLDIDYEVSSLCEAANYLDTSRWGYYALCRRPQNQKLTNKPHYRGIIQRLYPLTSLPQMLELAGKDATADYWITQGVFGPQRNRRKANMAHCGVAFVDLDYYKIRKLADLPPEAVLEMVLTRCQAWNIPLPSLVVDSGQGLQLKWFHDKLPSRALPRWEALQKFLVECLLDLGADTGAKDISRILRVVQTVNQKNGYPVRVLWQQGLGYTQDPYSFNEFIEAVYQAHIAHFRLTPPPVRSTKKKKKKKKKKTEVFVFNSRQPFSEDSLNWSRLCDLKLLAQLRGGDVGEGLREPLAFYLCNFFALRYSDELASNPLDNWHEFRSLCRTAAPYWVDAKIRDKTSNLYQLIRDDAAGKKIEFMGKEYRPLYTPRNDTLINLFGITDEEQRKLSTIISKDEVKRRKDQHQQTEAYKEEHRERNKVYQEVKRREAGARPQQEYLDEVKTEVNDKRQQAVELYQQGLSMRLIAKQMGCSKTAVDRYLKDGARFKGKSRKTINEKRQQAFELHKKGMSNQEISREMICSMAAVDFYLNSVAK